MAMDDVKPLSITETEMTVNDSATVADENNKEFELPDANNGSYLYKMKLNTNCDKSNFVLNHCVNILLNQ